MPSDALQDELIELQTKIQFQEDAMQKLDDELLTQKNTTDELVRRIAELEDKLAQVIHEQATGGDRPLDERPPHY